MRRIETICLWPAASAVTGERKQNALD
jgi:hypothetical protein